VRKRPMPIPETLNDCVLLHQMGYRVEINDGRVIAVAREKRKRKNGLKAALIPTPLYH